MSLLEVKNLSVSFTQGGKTTEAVKNVSFTLDKGKTYLMYCAHGKRGLKACGIMKDAAFTNVVNLEPGLSEWEKVGKPVKKK